MSSVATAHVIIVVDVSRLLQPCCSRKDTAVHVSLSSDSLFKQQIRRFRSRADRPGL
jgi:hypothetical protein